MVGIAGNYFSAHSTNTMPRARFVPKHADFWEAGKQAGASGVARKLPRWASAGPVFPTGPSLGGVMKRIAAILLIVVSLIWSPLLGWAQEAAVPDKYAIYDQSLMRPDQQTLDRWFFETATQPLAAIDPDIALRLEMETAGETTRGPSPILLDYITYTPSQRNQGSCGNCWVWAGTGILEIAHNVNNFVKDRLSIQKFNSCYAGSYACCGGWLSDFASFYSVSADPIPWSNTNAQFQDGGHPCPPNSSSLQTCGGITGTPDYPIPDGGVTATTIDTHSGQVAAIANIKNVLNQHKGVWWAFFLGNSTDWGDFYDFWDNNGEDTIWNPDPYCGHTYGTGGGGHAVVVVGYNDDNANPDLHYWIVLNSWGTAGGNRPNGLLRLKMNMNYDCSLTSLGYNHSFQTLNVANFTNKNRLYMAAKGGANQRIYVRNYAGSVWSDWTQLPGYTTHAPTLVNFNSRLYMFVKGVGTNKIFMASKNYQDTWTAWADISGSTNRSPAAVVFRNRLYLFVKGNASGTIYYRSMDTNGTWDAAWSTVEASNTIDSPAVTVFNDKLVLFQTGSDGYISSKAMDNDGTWTGWGVFSGDTLGMQTDAAPSATVFNNQIWLFVKGLHTTPYSNSISYITSSTDWNWWWEWNQVPGTTSTTPSVVSGPKANQLCLAVKGAASTSIYYRYYDNVAETWGNWIAATGATTDTPAVDIHYFGGTWP
jgi:hypothetical protein